MKIFLRRSIKIPRTAKRHAGQYIKTQPPDKLRADGTDPPRAPKGRVQAAGFPPPVCASAVADRKGLVVTMIMDRIALIISIIGALNWGSIGLFRFDIVAWICGGSASVWARIVYTVVALAGIWCISLLFRTRETFESLEEGDTTAGK